MIKIYEDRSKNLGGLTSIFILFDKVNQDAINVIKAFNTYYYKDNEWELPLNSLSYILDNLTYFDDIELDLLDYKEPDKIDRLIDNYKITPLKHQYEGIEFGLTHNKFLLLDEPGLGKTAQIIHIAEELQKRYNISHCLIICGIASLRANWESEIQKHSNLTFRTIGKRVGKKGGKFWASVNERAEELLNNINEFFVIINIESLRDQKIINAIKKGANKFEFMVVDEIHKCAANTESIQGKNLMSLNADYKIGATGTLITNSPLSAYGPLVWINKERNRFLTKFKNTFCTFDLNTLGKISGYKNLEVLKDMLDQCSLRRQKELLNLPEKNFINEYLIMEDSQFKFYEDIKNSVKSEYKKQAIEACDKIKLKTANLLALITRLRQATSCPNMLTSSKIDNCKIERVKLLVEEIVSNGDKVVIMSNFKEPVYTLEKQLQSYHPLIATGDTNDEDTTVKQFQEDDIHKVFICTISKLGTGVTLNRASYMIFIDMPWTYSNYTQATDRIWRIGTKKPVFIYNLICQNTIDESVAKIISKKKQIGEYLVENKIETEKDELLFLLESSI